MILLCSPESVSVEDIRNSNQYLKMCNEFLLAFEQIFWAQIEFEISGAQFLCAKLGFFNLVVPSEWNKSSQLKFKAFYITKPKKQPKVKSAVEEFHKTSTNPKTVKIV